MYHPQSSGLVECTLSTIKSQLAIIETLQIPWPKELPLVLLNFRSTSLRPQKCSPLEIVTGYPMHPGLLLLIHSCIKGDILQYSKDLTASIKNNHALAEQSFHSKLSGYKSLRHHTFQPGDVLCWKRFQKDSLQSHWKGPYQELLINTCAAKLQGTDLCIHITHSVT